MDIKLEEELMQLDLVKNHVREAHKLLHAMAMQDCKVIDIKDPVKFNDMCSRNELNRKARDLLSTTLFILKTEFVKMYWAQDEKA